MSPKPEDLAPVKHLLHNHWSRKVRLQASKVLSYVDSDKVAKWIIDATDKRKIPQYQAVRQFSQMTCSSAANCLVEVFLRDRWHWTLNPDRFDYLITEVLPNYKWPSTEHCSQVWSWQLLARSSAILIASLSSIR